jgi:2,3,4,5-tetrahydropyridine-2-carboxylate N-succinyltransferase
MSQEAFIAALEEGTLRAASPNAAGEWIVDQRVKEGILDLFRSGQLHEFDGAYAGFVDKHHFLARAFKISDGVRLVPGGSSVRRGAHVAKNVIIMPPSFINIGAFVDTGTLVDSHVLVGSCAQIGKRVHLSAGVQIGGVLEPIGAQPCIIEDDAFIGAGVVIVEGIRIGKNAVIAPGVTLSRATPIYDCLNECLITDCTIPEGVVVVPGSRPATQPYAKKMGLSLHCALIVKKRDEQSNASLSLEDALRAMS